MVVIYIGNKIHHNYLLKIHFNRIILIKIKIYPYLNMNQKIIN